MVCASESVKDIRKDGKMQSAVSISPTNDNLDRYAEPKITEWLVDAALSRTFLTYGEAKQRLEKEHNFSHIWHNRPGYCAEQLMRKIQKEIPDAPLLNALLVNASDKMPGEGIADFFSKHYNNSILKKKGIREKNEPLWRKYSEMATEEVYNYFRWPYIYTEIYKKPYTFKREELRVLYSDCCAEENSALGRRGGEGPNHKALRQRVHLNPEEVFPDKSIQSSRTEHPLPSGDRLDVLYIGIKELFPIEIKSKDS